MQRHPVLPPVLAIFLSTLLIACASQDTIKKGQADSKKPVNCATAEADITVLQSEKTHTSQQMAAGVSSIVPVGLVVGTVTGQEGTNVKVAAGSYNKMLDNKIAEIKRECGLK
jgi:type IV pilus biogenesis protein CpaD/CtpE